MKLNSYLLIGVLLISFGVLWQNSPMSLPQPKMLSVYPYDNLVIYTDNLTEINAYVQVQSADASIHYVHYIDNCVNKTIELHRANNVSINYYWIPDFNGDGCVDDTDMNIILNYSGEYVPPAPEEYDFNDDGYIGVDDITIVSGYYGTYIYVAEVTWTVEPGTYDFYFEALTDIGYVTYNGTLTLLASDSGEEGEENGQEGQQGEEGEESSHEPPVVSPIESPFPPPSTTESGQVPLSFVLILAGGALVIFGVYKIKPDKR